tara:strand:- start:216 stop:692 length:477 start_codon:yes stop_codon:yes gene_type:complete
VNEEFIKEKRQVIETACKNICKHSDIWRDLSQEVNIYFLTNALPENLDKIDGFIFVVAYKMYHLSGSEFNRLHFDNVLIESTELDYLKEIDIPYISDNVYKEYVEQVKQLDEMERIWVEEIVKRNLSIRLFSAHTGIHRATATERMNLIYEKLRNKNK